MIKPKIKEIETKTHDYFKQLQEKKLKEKL